MGNPILQLKQVNCERDDRELFKNLSYDFYQGSIVQLEGPNGAGKTTLLRILAGLYLSFDGELCFKGESLHRNLLEYQQSLLFIGHKSAVKTSLTPLENLRYAVGLKRRFDESELWDALKAVGLCGYEHALCRNMSAGQQRRVALARLYLSHEDIWILDEIFTAIDKKGVAQFEELLSLKASEGKTIILTTHHQLQLPDLRVLSIANSNVGG